MCWTTWWVLRSFLVDFTITASATARLLRWRQGSSEERFRRELLASGLCLPPAAYAGIPVDELQERYDTTLRALLDKHAPCRTARHRCQPTTPGSMPTVPRPSAGQGRSNGGVGGRCWILIGWSGLGKPGKNNNYSPPNKISSGRKKFWQQGWSQENRSRWTCGIPDSGSTSSKLRSHLFIVDWFFSVFHSCTLFLSIAFFLCRAPTWCSLAGVYKYLNWIEWS